MVDGISVNPLLELFCVPNIMVDGAAKSCSLELLQQYFSANEQYFPLTTNQHTHQQKPNFSETNRAGAGWAGRRNRHG
jgi:hypothetical protein